MPSRVGQDDSYRSAIAISMFSTREAIFCTSQDGFSAADKPTFFIRPMGNITLNISLVANFSNTNKQECKLK